SDKRGSGPAVRKPGLGRETVALFLRAVQSLEEGNLAEVERAARKLLDRDKTWAEPHYLLGEAARRRSEYAEAERQLRRAIQLEPRVHHFHHVLANVLQDAGQVEAAI